ncbi:unnamed protein product [Acanthoscelides obtectus]|uniref:Uncharacterized protein n=1 Tax=Acanthoscelides obtectus TaxID=200917 RepID=A0A9P0QER5_ACAOB|nr:unnamed protein product [Acanthoscelides obtectus]CAK1689209.1 hypothetical protein AOBTE_LOCUS37083 [Acanthoscelides obtectus]
MEQTPQIVKTAESEQYRDYESVFIIPGTSVDANRGKKVMNHEADARDEADTNTTTTTANENAPTTVRTCTH